MYLPSDMRNNYSHSECAESHLYMCCLFMIINKIMRAMDFPPISLIGIYCRGCPISAYQAHVVILIRH